MLYDDGEYYKWAAADANDDPNYLKGTEYSELNRTEGYEVIGFINRLGDKYWTNQAANTKTYQKIEKMIRYDVPVEIKDHTEIGKWIVSNWNQH